MAPTHDLAALKETVSSTLLLLKRFSSVLLEKTDDSSSPIRDPPEPLSVIYDAAKLLKAHTTKLSLLVINKPFTPSAIRKVIAEITSGCLPAIMSAVEICRQDVYGRTLHEELKFRVRRVFSEYEGMMQEVLAKAEASQSTSKIFVKKENLEPPRDSLSSTGVVWEACDTLMELKALGMTGVIVKKAEGYRAMLQDAIEELKDWGQGEDEGFSEPEFSDDADSIEKMFSSGGKLPADRPDLKPILQTSLKKLKLINTLYQAVIKRRLKTITSPRSTEDPPSTTPAPMAVDHAEQVLDILKSIPEETDELANAFYELDNDETLRIQGVLVQKGKDVFKVIRTDWGGKEDEFSAWSDKWVEAVDKT